MAVDIVETNLQFTSLSERSVTDMVVIHHTGCNDIDASAEQIHGWHLDQGWAGIGYHYVIRKDGTIERGRPEWAIGSHAYGENSHTIGIHLSGDFEQAEPTEAQIRAAGALIADVCSRYGIPVNRHHIVGHGELMETACPGENLQALLDDGTLIAAAEGKLDPVTQEPEGARSTERYNTIAACPEWARATVTKLIDRGLISGNGMQDEAGNPADMDLSRDMLRLLVINDRAGVYDE